MNSIRPSLVGTREISRRDFLNGALIAAGGLAVSQSVPLRALAQVFPQIGTGVCADAIGNDPRAVRRGNSPSTFNVGHWLRDRRLKFDANNVTLTPGCDGNEGTFSISDDSEKYDVIIAGGGLAGLSSAFYALRKRPGLKILMLEANQFPGGNASSDDQPPLPVKASTGGAYASVPDEDYLIEMFKATHMDEHAHIIQPPIDAYYFDENTPGVKPGYRGWVVELLSKLGKGGATDLKDAPYDDRVMADLQRCVQTFIEWGSKEGAPDEPPDLSSAKYDYLSRMSFASYLTDVLHCDQRVVDFYTQYTIDCMGGTPHYVNAHTCISFLSSDYTSTFFAPPGGTSHIAEQLVAWLTKSDGNGSADHDFRIKLQAIALQVDANPRAPGGKVSVTYFNDGKFYRATGKALILATQAHVARNLVEHMLTGERKAAWDEFNTVPAVVANVAVRDMTPFLDLGLVYSNYFWGSKHWSNFIVADWTTEDRFKPDRPSVLSFYDTVTVPPDEFAVERMKVLSTPFVDYENSLKEDLSRLMRGSKFDFDRDVSAVFVYRWGHSMILPTTRSVFGDVVGPNGRIDRTKAPRHIACRPLGPISFAGQYAEGTPSVESALGSGYRAAREVMAHL